MKQEAAYDTNESKIQGKTAGPIRPEASCILDFLRFVAACGQEEQKAAQIQDVLVGITVLYGKR